MVAVGLSIFLATVDASIVNVALPTLEEAFATRFPVVQWVVLAYLLTLATLTLGIGRLGDMVGKKGIFTTGFLVFVAGSVLCGLAPTVTALIGFRILQAVGAAMVLALGFALITEAFPSRERGLALGVAGGLVSVGIVVGPALGGLLLATLSWRWIFFVNVPVGLVGTVAAARFVRAVPPPGGQRFDFAGAGAFFVMLFSLLLALTLGQALGFADVRILALLALSALALGAFVALELRTHQPMVDLRLFRHRDLTVGLTTGFATFVAIAGLILLMPFYLENVLGYGPLAVGLLIAAAPVSLGIVAPLSGWLSDRVGTRPMTVAGLVVLTLAYLGITRLSTDTSTLGFVLALTPVGVGMGLFQSPNNSAIMGSVPPAQLGVTSGMLSLNRFVGQVAGVAVLGTVWATLTVAQAPAGFTGEATDAPAADQAAALQATALVMAILMAVALALAAWSWRHPARAGRGRGAAGAAPLRTESVD